MRMKLLASGVMTVSEDGEAGGAIPMRQAGAFGKDANKVDPILVDIGDLPLPVGAKVYVKVMVITKD